MARIYFWSAVAFMLLLLATTRASAAPFTPELDYAYELANEHWNGPPTGCSSIDFEIVGESSLGEGIEGWATIPPTNGEPIPCVLYIVRKLAQPDFFPRACAVLRHEDGHLHGFEHSSDPRSIMYPSITYIPSQCDIAMLYVMNHPRRFGRRR
jgi:hypothetical protein